jgi:uncharacterized protein HemX
VLQALLAQAPENPYWNPTTITFYGVVIAALLAGPAAIMLQGRIRAQEAEAAARRKREDEQAKAERQREAKDAEENTENVAWLRGQVGALQHRVDAAERREDDRQRQIGHLQGELRGLRDRLRERDSDDRARDGRIAQLEAALVSARITVPPPAADYLALLERESRHRRRPREEDRRP